MSSSLQIQYVIPSIRISIFDRRILKVKRCCHSRFHGNDLAIGVPIKIARIRPLSGKCIFPILLDGKHGRRLTQIDLLGRRQHHRSHHWNHHRSRRCCHRKNFLHWNRLCRCRCRQHDLIIWNLVVWNRLCRCCCWQRNLVVWDLVIWDFIVPVCFGICRHRQFLIFRDLCRIFRLCRIFPLYGYCHRYIRIDRYPN